MIFFLDDFFRIIFLYIIINNICIQPLKRAINSIILEEGFLKYWDIPWKLTKNINQQKEKIIIFYKRYIK